MNWPRLNPLTQKKLQRFRSIKRGYYSFVTIMVLLLASLASEMLVNSRALIVHYGGDWYFPTYSGFLAGRTFGLDYAYETDYRDLGQRFEASGGDNWLLMPPIPYDPFETDLEQPGYPPYPPSMTSQHYLGTDTAGRDVAARLIYGFRIAMMFSLLLLLCNYAIGVAVGCAMGFWGGAFDLFFQRLIEVWSNVPFLYVIMIIASIIVPNFITLALVMVIFGWMSMTWYMRTTTYREKARDYVQAARALGASHSRIIFNHILPNSISVIVTFMPFAVTTGITSLTALDYLGFGLPPPTPSWGELLAQGTSNLNAPWIVTSVVSGMGVILLMVTYVGEAVREAFDPKKFTFYE